MSDWIFCMKIAIVWLPFLLLALAISNLMAEFFDGLWKGGKR